MFQHDISSCESSNDRAHSWMAGFLPVIQLSRSGAVPLHIFSSIHQDMQRHQHLTGQQRTNELSNAVVCVSRLGIV